MLQNREFVDAKVNLFGKHGSRTWIEMASSTSIATCSPTSRPVAADLQVYSHIRRRPGGRWY
jgi:hypothetical protein